MPRLLDGGARVLVSLPDLQRLRNTAEAACVSGLLQTGIEYIGNRDGSVHGDAPHLDVLCSTIILGTRLWV